MAQHVEIQTSLGQVLFKGLLLDLPFKEVLIVSKSIDIFDDEDPCVIHRSFVVKNLVDEFLKKIPLKIDEIMRFNSYQDALEMLNFTSAGDLWITLRVV